MDRQSVLIITKAVLASKCISKTTALLLMQLEDHRNKRTGQCNPKIATLAREIGVCERTIDSALGQLRSLGLLLCRKGQRGSTYEVAARAEWAEILRRKNLRCARRKNCAAEPAHPYMNLTNGTRKGRAS